MVAVKLVCDLSVHELMFSELTCSLLYVDKNLCLSQYLKNVHRSEIMGKIYRDER